MLTRKSVSGTPKINHVNSAATSGPGQWKCWWRSGLSMNHPLIHHSWPTGFPYFEPSLWVECWHIAHFNLLKFLLPPWCQWVSLSKWWIPALGLAVWAGSCVLAYRSVAGFINLLDASRVLPSNKWFGRLPLEFVLTKMTNVCGEHRAKDALSCSACYSQPKVGILLFEVQTNGDD